ADHPRGVADEEGDGLGAGRAGGHDQVALVLAVLVVDDHDDLASGDGRDGVLDRGEHRALAPLLGQRFTGHDGSSDSERVRSSTPPSRRSAYLAMTSTSMLTGSPTARRPSVVTSDVWGINATVNTSSRTSTTVRLTPSTVTDPFSTR